MCWSWGQLWQRSLQPEIHGDNVPKDRLLLNQCAFLMHRGHRLHCALSRPDRASLERHWQSEVRSRYQHEVWKHHLDGAIDSRPPGLECLPHKPESRVSYKAREDWKNRSLRDRTPLSCGWDNFQPYCSSSLRWTGKSLLLFLQPRVFSPTIPYRWWHYFHCKHKHL